MAGALVGADIMRAMLGPTSSSTAPLLDSCGLLALMGLLLPGLDLPGLSIRRACHTGTSLCLELCPVAVHAAF